ncbi:MAG: glycoside hydrolase 43 family protein [Lachnospiraceae bacterium]|nr:glycoside hydrolase 43 family protein [Lachnospiraceae bacterium]
MWIADNGDGTYSNPILYTDYSDPDVIRVGEDYFMVASSFCNAPSVPLLHSKDLVNWKVINYCMEKLPISRYDKPVHGCGAWAPAIRYHEGIYYVFVPFPDEGIFMCKTTDPWGIWSEPTYVRQVTGWIDPCPFWDEDGKAYMVTAFARSRIGFKSILHLSSMEPDCSGVLDDGKHIFDGSETQPTIEGPKLYKRNGYYYIFAPAGGVKPGWQTVLRSKNIWGPYEEKIVLHQGNTEINGPHQGAWIDTPSGEDWFIHFQDVGNAGRIIHLQPMYWEDDWPVIGVNAVEGCGEPVITHKKPEVGAVYEADAPEDSDFFDGEKLGLQWQWNANYSKDWYALGGEQPGITLYAQPIEPGTKLCDVSNLLIQKWPAPEFSITTKLDISGLADRDVAGLVNLGGIYTCLAVKCYGAVKKLVFRRGTWDMEDELERACDEVETDTIYLRMQVEEESVITYSYSVDGETFKVVGDITETAPGRWVGVKSGLFAINEKGVKGGSLRAEYFVFEEL